MKITHLASGEDYNLAPGTKIEVERTNPFFNEYGEQTTPLDLPASERNRRLLGFPDTFGRRAKMTPMDAAIQDGEYFAQCRQVILSAQHEGSISTSFYINDGSFYSRIQNVKLKDIFKDEYIPGIDTVEQGIDFCRSLRANTNDKYGIFPILVESDSGRDTGFNYKVVNAYGRDRSQAGGFIPVTINGGVTFLPSDSIASFDPDDVGSGCDFYNAVQRTEYVNDVPITLLPGYYITPFIRSNYLLKRIFSYFGYELQENFFTRTEPFSKMVVLNKVIDTLVNGRIKVADLVPDVTCSEFISVFRKKFCCEFTSDEGRRTADVIFLREALESEPVDDFTRLMTGEPVISYKADTDYQRVVLASEDKVGSDLSDTYEDLKTLVSANPSAYLNPVDGAFYKEGFAGGNRIISKIGECSQDYNTGEELKAKEVRIADMMPEPRELKQRVLYEGNEVIVHAGSYLFVGPYITLNSKMVLTVESDTDKKESASKQPVMLAFNYQSGSRPAGGISSYDTSGTRIFDYSLFYHGNDGIFERFYRDYDLLLRNSLHEMKVRLLLSQSQKQNIPAHAKVVIRGVPFFLNKFKFTLGGSNEPVESDLRTIALMEPIVSAPRTDEQLTYMTTEYKWVGRFEQIEVSENDYNNSGPDKDRTFTAIYPPKPSVEHVGKRYGEQSSFISQKHPPRVLLSKPTYTYTRTNVWLECIRR